MAQTGNHKGLTFGIFLAPFHRVGENPTLSMARDMELVEWIDGLGFDEAWIGEHHSAGWETIASGPPGRPAPIDSTPSPCLPAAIMPDGVMVLAQAIGKCG